MSGSSSYHKPSAADMCSVGQVLLVALAIAWSVFERGAPVINVRWRDGMTTAERSAAERQLFLEAGESTPEAWRYELTWPSAANIEAIVRHPDITDTHHLDRATMRVDPGATPGASRVWSAGPFTGSDGARRFRYVFALIAALTLASAWLARRQSAALGVGPPEGGPHITA